MVNSEVYGGLVSALSRGQSWYDAMMSFYSAGYSKKDIEEAAGILKSQMMKKTLNNPVNFPESKTPAKEASASKPALKPAFGKKPVVPLRPEAAKPITPSAEKPYLKTGPSVKQNVSSYILSKEIPSKKEVSPAPSKISDIQKKSLPPVQQPQNISNYSTVSSKGKRSRPLVAALFIILIILLVGLIAAFIFRDKILEVIGSFGF